MKADRIANMRLFTLARALAALIGAGGAPIALAADVARFTETASSISVDVRGTVNAGSESVAFAGPVLINARTVTDPKFGSRPNVELMIDLSAVAGRGLSTGNKYVTQSHEVISLPLPADGNGDIGIDFPYQASNAAGFAADGVARAGFKLIFVTQTGSLAIGRGWIGVPPVVAPGKK